MSGKGRTLGILISGRGTNLQAILDAVRDGKLRARIGVVISNVATAAGLDRATKAGAPTTVIDHKSFATREEASQKSDDFALPYDLDDEKKVVKVPFRNIDEVGPAGSINSNVEEMIRYVRFHIDKGKHGDEQILSTSNAEEMQIPQMVIPGNIDYDELGHSSYGMGFIVTSYKGHKLVQHGGGIDGFISLLSFMPRKQMGMIVLTNSSGNNPVPSIVTRNLYDRLLGLEQVPWAERIKKEREKTEAAEEAAKEKGYIPRKDGTRPTHALSDYAGTYEHPAYGSVRVDLEGEALEVSFHGANSTLEHFHYDIFETPEDPLNPLGGTKATFLYNKKGDVDRLAIPMEPQVEDIIFHRMADPSMRKRTFLEPFVGEYELGPNTLTVSLQGDDTLVLAAPGQPIRELVPTRGTSFDVKGRAGFSVEFKKDEIVLHQPAGSFVGKKK